MCVTLGMAMVAVLCQLNVRSKSVVDMKWFHTSDTWLRYWCTLFIWNVECAGTKRAKCTFYETVVQLAFDPFNPCVIVTRVFDLCG